MATSGPSLSNKLESPNFVNKHQDPKGLTTIWPLNYDDQREAMNCGIDVVAVNGLNGGSFRTWTEGGVLWIRDLLRSKLPNPRIMMFGYNANLYSDCAAGRIKDFAHNLCSMLEGERDTPQALVIANGKTPETSILRSPGGIVFLATPHRGSKSAIWAEIGTRMLKAAKLGAPGTSSAKELKFFSTTVQDIEEDFVPLSSKFKIVGSFEQKGYPGLGLIVEATSAKMQVASELHTIGLDVTHGEMSHFPDANDENYKSVERSIISLVRQQICIVVPGK